MHTGTKLCLRLGCLFLAVFATQIASRGDSLDFTNSSFITINDGDTPPTIASPYPSVITVSNLTGQWVTNLTVTLNGFSHTFPSDVNILLVGPTGQAAILMSDVGGDNQFPVTNLVISLNDADPDPLPILDPLFSGGFHPTARQVPLAFNFPSPAPAGNSNAPAQLSVFNNSDPTGAWKLFVVDDVSGDSGSISGGWSLSVSTGVPLQTHAAGSNLVFSWPVIPGENFALQTSPAPTNAGSWSNLVGSVVQTNGRNTQVSSNATHLNTTRFYRLIGQ